MCELCVNYLVRVCVCVVRVVHLSLYVCRAVQQVFGNTHEFCVMLERTAAFKEKKDPTSRVQYTWDFSEVTGPPSPPFPSPRKTIFGSPIIAIATDSLRLLPPPLPPPPPLISSPYPFPLHSPLIPPTPPPGMRRQPIDGGQHEQVEIKFLRAPRESQVVFATKKVRLIALHACHAS